jgi:hexosaminidase
MAWTLDIQVASGRISRHRRMSPYSSPCQRVWVNDTFAGRFEVFVFGGRNTLFSWSQMALVAPLETVQGGVDALLLEAGVGIKNVGNGGGTSAIPPMSNGATSHQLYGVSMLAVVFGLAVLQLLI